MSSPSTPERHASSDEKLMSVTTPTRADAPASQANVSVDIYNDEDVKDIENQHNLVGLNSSYNATPSDVANMHVSAVNSTINDSMTLDNCKFINESDPQIQHTPSPSENNDMMIPSSPNLTPVKSLDQDLSKEQDTMTSSPTDSQNLLDNSDGSTPTLSRRERRTRLLKCYGLVAVVVLLCAIGIPLVAVLLFKEENSQSASLESNQINSDGTSVVVDDDMMPSVVTESEETTTEPVAVPATTDPISSGKEESDFLLMEDTNAPGTEEDSSEGVETEASLNEKNITTESAPAEVPAIEEEEEETTEVPQENTDAPEVEVVEEEVPPETQVPVVIPLPVTNAPTPKGTRAPGPDRSPIYFELVNVTEPAVLQDTTSAQALSFLWLVEQDEILPVPTGKKLLQRYILVLMDHIFHDPVRPVLSQGALDECEWEGIVCDEETGDVLQINWSRKNLNGQLVDEMRHLDSLERIDLSENNMTGSLKFLYETKSLREVYLNNNQFSGPLEEQIGLITGLEKLYLGHNELTGQIPISLRSPVGEAKPLKWLVLAHNKFTGYLPPDWRMRNLYYLDLGYNSLSGPLPNDWDTSMVRLRHLFLDHNSFTGTVPGYFSDLGKGRIKQINVQSNFLEGEVPSNWVTKDQLVSLNFQDNNMTTPVDPLVCELSIFEGGMLVELRVDCDICTCDTLCKEQCN